MGKVFISYRRKDSWAFTQQLASQLGAHIGEDNVFIDVEGIAVGEDFRKVIHNRIRACGVVVAVIGDEWLTVEDDQGRRRLDNEADWVRLELESALAAGKRIIPVLVGDVSMPTADALPNSLGALSTVNAAVVRSGRDFDPHMRRLIEDIEQHVEKRFLPRWWPLALVAIVLVGSGVAAVAAGQWPPKNPPPVVGATSTTGASTTDIVPTPACRGLPPSNTKRYELTACGSIIDHAHNLEWCVGNDQDYSWNEAGSWTRALEACGGGWRMPVIAELAPLRTDDSPVGDGWRHEGKSYKAHLDPAFAGIGSGAWVWSDHDDKSSLSFPVCNFYIKNCESKATADGYDTKEKGLKLSTRAFAVRDADL